MSTAAQDWSTGYVVDVEYVPTISCPGSLP